MSERQGKPPAYQHYPADFLSDEDTATMTLEEEGAYRRLLDHHWREGSIPADPEQLRRLLKWISRRRFSVIWPAIAPCFKTGPEPGRLTNPRLSLQKTELDIYRAEMSEKGRKGAETLHANRARAMSRAVPNPGSASASASASAEEIREREPAPDRSLRQSAAPPTAEAGVAGVDAGVDEPGGQPAELTLAIPASPLRTVSRKEAGALIAAAAGGVYVDSKPSKGAVFKLDAARKLDAQAAAAGAVLGDTFRRVGRWLAAGGDWRTAKGQRLDGRNLGDLDAWIAQSRAWDGKPITPTNGQHRPDRVTDEGSRRKLARDFGEEE